MLQAIQFAAQKTYKSTHQQGGFKPLCRTVKEALQPTKDKEQRKRRIGWRNQNPWIFLHCLDTSKFGNFKASMLNSRARKA